MYKQYITDKQIFFSLLRHVKIYPKQLTALKKQGRHKNKWWTNVHYLALPVHCIRLVYCFHYLSELLHRIHRSVKFLYYKLIVFPHEGQNCLHTHNSIIFITYCILTRTINKSAYYLFYNNICLYVNTMITRICDDNTTTPLFRCLC